MRRVSERHACELVVEAGATNSQIRIELNYPGLNEILDHIAGHYLYRLVDANGIFSPVIIPFAVVQKGYAQGVSGQATAAGTGLPLTNAVLVLAPQNGKNGFGTIADANGNFSFDTNFPLDGSADGMHTVSLRATDVSGRESTFFDVYFRLDT